MITLELTDQKLALLLSSVLIAEEQFKNAASHTAQWKMADLAEVHKCKYIELMGLRADLEKTIQTN